MREITYTGRTVDLTPTWSGILPGLLAIIENGETVEARKTAEAELRRMATLADRYVASVKDPSPRQRAAALLSETDINGILSQAETCIECGEPLTVEGLGDGGSDPQHVFCDICGKAEHPADLTPDWNGETGNHKSCEQSRIVDEAYRIVGGSNF